MFSASYKVTIFLGIDHQLLPALIDHSASISCQTAAYCKIQTHVSKGEMYMALLSRSSWAMAVNILMIDFRGIKFNLVKW